MFSINLQDLSGFVVIFIVVSVVADIVVDVDVDVVVVDVVVVDAVDDDDDDGCMRKVAPTLSLSIAAIRVGVQHLAIGRILKLHTRNLI